MGLKDDLINAKLSMIQASGGDPSKVDTSPGSPIDIECELTTEAIVQFLTQSEFRVTKLSAPVVVESMKTPDQPVSIELETLLGEYGPVLELLHKIGDPLGLNKLIDELETKIERAVTPLLERGAKLTGLDLGKDDGGLEAHGYVYIGEDPETQESFDVEDEDGQREYTTVKLSIEDQTDLV